MLNISADGMRRVEPLRPDDPTWLGPYRMLGRLGQGGMGVVFLAEAPDRRPVAVKLVRSGLSDDREFIARFRSEVGRASQVPPFCTAEVLDSGVDHDPPYLVTEYVDGPSLAEAIKTGGPLSPARLQAVAVGVATALVAIHGAGVIHRDLKPQNVLLAPGSPKVIDFGIARAFEVTSHHTRTNQFVGTVSYMAPERFDNGTDADLSAAADVFAWGCVIAYAGTGRTPFQGDTPTATAARILTQPPLLDGLAEPMRSLVARTLAKDPGGRPTARQILDELVGSGQPVPSADPRRPLVAASDRHPPRVRRRALLAGSMAIVLAAAGLGLWSLFGGSSESTRAGHPQGGSSKAAAVTSPSKGAPTATVPAPAGLAAWVGEGHKGCDLGKGVLNVASKKGGLLGCGPPAGVTLSGDLRLTAQALVAAGDACLAFWFHWKPGGDGNVISVCQDTAILFTVDRQSASALLTVGWKSEVPSGAINKYQVDVGEGVAEIKINGKPVGRAVLPPVAPEGNQVQIGIYRPIEEGSALGWLRIYDAKARAS